MRPDSPSGKTIKMILPLQRIINRLFSKELLRWFIVLDLIFNSVLIGVIIHNATYTAGWSGYFPRHALSDYPQKLGMYFRHRHHWQQATPTPTPAEEQSLVIPTEQPTPTPTPVITDALIESPTNTPTPTPTQSEPTPTPTSIPTPTAIAPTVAVSANTKQMFVTFYGWNDNDPPGANIAYPHSQYQLTAHEKAGGSGTYDDPISLATDPNEFAIGTRFYAPYLQRYFVMEDWCAGCVDNWQKNPPKYHIDLWTNSNGSLGDQLIQCENSLTRDGIEIEINPPGDRAVSSAPLFNTTDGTCFKP